MSNKNTNSIFVAGIPKWVKVRQAGESVVTSFSLNHTDRKDRKHFFNVSMWNLSEDKIEILKKCEDEILVKGRLRFDEYEKDGLKVRTVAIDGFDFDTKLEAAPKPTEFAAAKDVSSKAPTANEMINAENDPFDDATLEDDPFGQ